MNYNTKLCIAFAIVYFIFWGVTLYHTIERPRKAEYVECIPVRNDYQLYGQYPLE